MKQKVLATSYETVLSPRLASANNAPFQRIAGNHHLRSDAEMVYVRVERGVYQILVTQALLRNRREESRTASLKSRSQRCLRA